MLRKRVAIVIAFVVMAITILCMIKGLTRVQTGVLPGLTQEELQVLQQEVDTQFGFLINRSPSFSNGNALGNLRIQNLPANKYNMQVTIKLINDITVYESPLLKPNQYVERDKLDVSLENDIYNAIAEITVLDEEGFKGRIKVNLKLYVGYVSV